MARDGLDLRLRRLVEKTKDTNAPQTDRGQLRVNGKTTPVLIEVVPLKHDGER